MAEKQFSNLDIMKDVDAFPYADTEPAAHAALASTLYTLTWGEGEGEGGEGQTWPLGYMLSCVVDELEAVPEPIRGPLRVDRAARTVRAFEHGFDGEPARSAAVAAVMRYWRERDTFEVLRGWRDELWPVYGPDNKEVIYSVERSGVGLLGTTRYGVHMTAYTRDGGAGDGAVRMWVARRAATKPTYPGMLDNSAAGGLMTGEDPLECIVREADEEADLQAAFLRPRIRPVGTLTYLYLADGRAGGEPSGQIYPEMQWVYEVELPAGGGDGDGDGAAVRPRPKDGEVARFELMDLAQVKAELARGAFKPNCALVVLDFFVRHGVLTRENEPHLDEIVRRMHRPMPFPGPHQLEAPTVASAPLS